MDDTAPDRWGRRLIARRLRAVEAGTPRTITDVDFLLGVADTTRQGALRFRTAGSDAFCDNRADVPKQIQLPALLQASDAVAREDDDLAAVKLLLDAGTGTLGGARPKASVLDAAGRLHIAKFPHPEDEWDVMAWEKTTLDLAAMAGILVPKSALARVSGRSVLLLQRFDRDATGTRIGYLSGMSLIGGSDGGHHDYVDLAYELADVSGAADADLEELWRRAAFSVAVNNTDDHMRNHGLLRHGPAWRLSPVFDVNPNPDRAEQRATSIDGATTATDARAGLERLATYCGLSASQQGRVLADVSSAVAHWRTVATRHGINATQQSFFAPMLDGTANVFD